jgi:hypothetical protein
MYNLNQEFNMQNATLAEHLTFINWMHQTGILKEPLNELQIERLAEYFVTAPDIAAMQLWFVLGSGAICNTIALHQKKINDTSPSLRLSEVLTDENRIGAVRKYIDDRGR